MKKQLLVIVVMTFGWAPSVMASMSVEQRLAQMEKRLAAQDKAIQNKDGQIAALADTSKSSNSGGWWEDVEMSGAVELEASHTSNQDIADANNNGNSSDLNVATVELGVAAEVNDWVHANVVLLWEEEDGGNNNLTVDEATITIGNSDVMPMYFTGGRMTVPFGSFETQMVSDPFTVNVGEASETVLLVGYVTNGFAGSIYAFNGDVDSGNNTIDNFGASLSYSMEVGDNALVLSASYINDIAEADGIADNGTFTTYDNEVSGISLNANYRFGAFSVIAEYVSATDNFQSGEVAYKGQGAEPSAWHAELGYSFDGIANGATVAVAYQETDEAVALGLPESRLSLALSIDLLENTALSLEWAHDEAYSTANGGTGQDANTATAKLVVEF